MNPTLLLTLTGTTKKQIGIVLATLAIIVSLPMLALFSLGSSVLSVLGHALSLGAAQSQGLYEGPLVVGDTYAWGNCTYWVFFLRQQANDPIPTSWGNANTWASNALLQGYTIDNTPTTNAIMQTSAGDLGHVAYVTAVDATNGNWTISEMNVKGLDIVDSATYAASAAKSFNFIHDKIN